MKIMLKPIHQQVVVLFGATSGLALKPPFRWHARARVWPGRARAVQRGPGGQPRTPRNWHRACDGRNPERQRAAFEQRAAVEQRAVDGRQHGHDDGRHERHRHDGGRDGGRPDGDGAGDADAADWDEVKGVADQVVARFGRIDTWVQAASVSEWALFEETTPMSSAG
jgi:hypothetical protein